MRPITDRAPIDAERRRALRVACNVLGYAERTESHLREKLTNRGFSPEIVDETIEKMKEMGYLNERRMLRRQIELMNRVKLWGKGRILHEILTKGYSRETLVGFSFDSEEFSDIDFDESSLKLLRRYEDADPQKQYGVLLRNGYTDREIRQAMRRLREEQEDRALEEKEEEKDE